ncbi:MAG: 4Fe-4S binding protein [Proteobacteria bacterium]|nr:4Fe-4S binding protein [Pseudomonadota bacterium]
MFIRKMQILSLFNNIPVEQAPVVELVQGRCLRRRLNTCGCHLCLEVCTSEALFLVDRQIQFDGEKCTGCMRCAAVCPNEALVTECDLEEVQRTVQSLAREQLVISCTRKKQLSADEIAVPCLGIFAEESLLAFGMSGCQSIVFNLDGCSDCENRDAATSFLTTRRRVLDIAAEFLCTGLLIFEGVGSCSINTSADRRAFLSCLQASLATIALGPSSFLSTDSPKTSGRRIPVRAKIIEKVFADTAIESRAKLLSLCTHRLTLSAACNRCPLCTGICPTGALRINGSGTDKQLLFTSTRCSGCGLCVSFCKQSAVSLSFSPLSAKEPIPAISKS